MEYEYTRFSTGAGYWETVTHPLGDAEDPALLEDYPWPKVEHFDFSKIADVIAGYEGYAVMTAPGYASPGILQNPIQTLVGMEKSLIDMSINVDFFSALVTKVMDFLLSFTDELLKAGNGKFDFFRIGDDFGTQRGLLIGPRQWRELLPSGSVQDVETGVKELLQIMAPSGGFFIGPTHNFQDDIPTENIAALYRTAREWRYRG